MSYLVFCTFDLKNATSQNYQTAYADLENLGLSKIKKADNGNQIVIPTTSVMGFFDGDSAVSVRDYVREKIKKNFSTRGFQSEIFIIVGGDWAWGATTT